MDLKLDAAQVETLIQAGFKADRPFFSIEELRPQYARTRMPFRSWMYRPGDVVSGPALFTAADLAMYALVLSHVGPAMMAVTSNLTIHFLNKGTPSDLLCEARLLKLGRKIAVMDVTVRCEKDEAITAHVTGSYALPTVR